MLRNFQRIDDCARIVALQPAIRRHRAFTFAVSASVHHHDAVSGMQQHARMFQNAEPVVTDTMKQQHPVPVRFCEHEPSNREAATPSEARTSNSSRFACSWVNATSA